MAITAGNGNNAISVNDPCVQLIKPLPQCDQTETRLNLTQALQTSLDLTTLLETFFRQVQGMVTLGGVLYLNRNVDCHTLVGQGCAQKLHYRLQTPQQDLGEITFSRRKRFSEAEMTILENLLSTLIFPLRNALLYREAVMTSLQDPLTGVGNRAALTDALARETRLASRHNQPLSILVIDIDHFKRINDNFGHSCGDKVLRQLGKAIRQIARQTDLTYRYGGEEFVLLLNKTDAQGARVIAERLRSRISRLKIADVAETIFVTASIGVATWQDDEDGEAMFKRADSALYRAKNEGRNRVAVA